MPGYPFTQLLVSAQRGDPAAIAKLLTETQPDIRRYARATCRASDVDDAVQDALCLMHRHVGRLRIAAAFSAWAFAIVRRECIRLARHGFGRSAPLEGLEDDPRLSERPNHELRLDLTAAIEALPTHYRQVLMLRDIEELTIDEIAGRLEATRETVKARLHRARAFVREYLQR